MGWELTTLGEVCRKIVDGSHNPPRKQTVGKPMLSAVNIQDGQIQFDGYRLINEDEFAREHERTQIEPGDVLLTIVGTIGRTTVVPSDCPEFTLQRSVAVLKPVEIDPKFMRYQIQGPVTNGYLNENAKGTAQKGIYLRSLGATPFLVPPAAQQIRIVEKIDTLFAELDKGEESLRQVQTLLARYRQSVLKAAVEMGPDGSSEKVRLGELLEDIRYGTAKKCRPDVEGVPVLRIPNVVTGQIDLEDLKFAELHEKEMSRLRLMSGDVLLVRSNGSANLVGRTAVVDDRAAGMGYAGYLIRLRVDRDRLLPEFLHIVLNSPEVRARIERQARSTSGVHNINSTEVRAIEFDLPPLSAQSTIVERVGLQLADAELLEAACTAELSRAAALRQSILKDAFSGRLVPQDPNDEPASELLARIRAERASQGRSSRSTRTKTART